MPNSKYGHCQITLNDTHLFLAAGVDASETFIMDVGSRHYTELDNLPRDVAYGACGLLNHPVNGQGMKI